MRKNVENDSTTQFFEHFLLSQNKLSLLHVTLGDKKVIKENLTLLKNIKATDPVEQTVELLLKWESTCFLNRFFDAKITPFYPLDVSSTIDFFFNPISFINVLTNNFASFEKYRNDFPIEFYEGLSRFPEPEIEKIIDLLLKKVKDMHEIGRQISCMNAFENIINYNVFFTHISNSISDIKSFLEGLLLSGNNDDQLLFAEKSLRKMNVLKDSCLSFCHQVLFYQKTKPQHFVDFSSAITLALFPSFDSVHFLLEIDLLGLENIEKRVELMPDSYFVRRFKNQFYMRDVLNESDAWNVFNETSIPKLASFDLYKKIISEFPDKTQFITISNDSFRNDLLFMKTYEFTSNLFKHGELDIDYISENNADIVYALIFVKGEDGKYILSFKEIKEILSKLNTLEINNNDELSSLIRKSFEKMDLIDSLMEEATVDDLYQPLNNILNENLDAVKSRIMKINPNFPAFANSLIIGNKFRNEGFDKTLLSEVPKEQQEICELNYRFSAEERPEIEVDSSLYKELVKRRMNYKKEICELEVADLSFDLTVDETKKYFNEKKDSFSESTKGFFNYLFGVIKKAPGHLIMKDALVKKPLDYLKAKLEVANSLNELKSDPELFELLIGNLTSLEIKQNIFEDIKMFYGLEVFIATSGAKCWASIANRSRPLHNWFERKLPGIKENKIVQKYDASDVASVFLKKHSLVEFDMEDEETCVTVKSILPLMIDDLLKKEITEEDADAFEDLIYFFDLKDSWSSVIEICRIIDRKFGRNLLDTISILLPIEKKKPAINENEFVSAFSEIIQDNSTFIESLFKTNIPFNHPEISAQFINIHKRFHGGCSDEYKLMRIVLSLNNEQRKRILYFKKPDELVLEVAKKISVKHAARLCEELSIDCSSLVMKELPHNHSLIELVKNNEMLDGMIQFIVSCLCIKDVKDEVDCLHKLNYLKKFVTSSMFSFNVIQLMEMLCRMSFSSRGRAYSSGDTHIFLSYAVSNDRRDIIDVLRKLGVEASGAMKEKMDMYKKVFTFDDSSASSLLCSIESPVKLSLAQFEKEKNTNALLVIRQVDDKVEVLKNRPKEKCQSLIDGMN